MHLYLHIPFCRKACTYCDFHFLTSLKSKGEMVDAMCKEMQLRKDFLGEKVKLKTVYFGGGTPSVLSEADFGKLWDCIYRNFVLSEDAEISLEANPDDLTHDYLKLLKAFGINRLSVGTQSFREADLRWMNRSHTAQQAVDSIRWAQEIGIENISLDLIFGIPNADDGVWEHNLQQAIELGVPHISVYALTVEEKTALHHQVKTGKVEIPSDERYQRQFLRAHEVLEAAGFTHYELSNYAKEGMRSRHNSAYWKGRKYLGIGPSAHSFDGENRFWNIAHNAKYKQALQQQELPTEQEQLSMQDRYNEYIMTQLRKVEGISLSYIRAHFQQNINEKFALQALQWQQNGWLETTETHWKLNPAGWLVSDHLISELFWVEE